MLINLNKESRGVYLPIWGCWNGGNVGKDKVKLLIALEAPPRDAPKIFTATHHSVFKTNIPFGYLGREIKRGGVVSLNYEKRKERSIFLHHLI